VGLSMYSTEIFGNATAARTVELTTICVGLAQARPNYLLEKKLPKTRHNLGVRNLYTHTMIANRWMNNWYKFRLHSLRQWEATTQ